MPNGDTVKQEAAEALRGPFTATDREALVFSVVHGFASRPARACSAGPLEKRCLSMLRKGQSTSAERAARTGENRGPTK
jgi:hypothetical protein